MKYEHIYMLLAAVRLLAVWCRIVDRAYLLVRCNGNVFLHFVVSYYPLGDSPVASVTTADGSDINATMLDIKFT